MLCLQQLQYGSNQKDQHGCQNIPAFDYYMAQGVLKTFKKQFRQTVYDYLEFTDFIGFIAINGISREIDKISSIEFDISIFDSYLRESDNLKRLFRIAYEKAIKKTGKIVYEAMEGFIHNLNTMNLGLGKTPAVTSINLGTDTSKEGRMVIEKYLLALGKGIGNGEAPVFPKTIFKLKEGINLKIEDKNYDLFKLACKVAAKRPGCILFSFLDSSYNKKYYEAGIYNTEATYMGCRTRILESNVDDNKPIVEGRGMLSATSINLPRLGIKHGIINNQKVDLSGFFVELEEKLELIKDELLERLEIQCNKNAENFPFLIGQEVWIDSEKAKLAGKLRRAYKHGTLGIGFIGLAECLKALTGKHHGESEEAEKLGLKIIKIMKEKIDEYSEKYNLNFVLLATPKDGFAKELIAMDKAIYGKIKGVTDVESYTDSFHIPLNYKSTVEQKIKVEAPYHKLTNGGHILNINLPEQKLQNEETLEKTIRLMKDNDIGLAVIK